VLSGAFNFFISEQFVSHNYRSECFSFLSSSDDQVYEAYACNFLSNLLCEIYEASVFQFLSNLIHQVGEASVSVWNFFLNSFSLQT
jgi:hypothetical protein